ncbi:MAG TPA: hypothetical protein DCS29_05055 [Candidatus Magasanikbacteria bacterium]|nr:MAG: hypothetical protein A2479_00760 [Candidatus Magasanikbacteria bacterium RIFOXYC2_FULL_39_8]HAT04102.1 hypothetical protein [Candidatus Magasanikbacteria bacterium]
MDSSKISLQKNIIQYIISKTKTPLFVFFLTLLIYGSFLFVAIRKNDYDLSKFIILGDKQIQNIQKIPKNIAIYENSLGYDGQFYFFIATNPQIKKHTELGIKIDEPPIRFQRILYPLLTKILALNRVENMPFVMLYINILAIGLMGYVGAHIAKNFNRHPIFGIILPLYPGFLLSLNRDLTEPLASLLLLTSYLLYQKNKMIGAAIIATLAVLTRETTAMWVLVVVVVNAYVYIKERRREDLRKILLFLIPPATFGIWQLYLTINLHILPIGSLSANTFYTPLQGIYEILIGWGVLKNNLIEIFFILATAIFVLIQFRKIENNREIKLAWASSFIMIFFLYTPWVEDYGFMRALTEFFLFSNILLLAGKKYITKLFIIYSFIILLNSFFEKIVF